ncbi:MAG TPA: DUF2332 family protein, partial [Symbiobacteriaceae bacterium]|nr:DUF2332 family protein [Symbiobacteriaceae bacterium]
PAVADLFGRYYQILSNEEPNVPLFLAGLHHLALTGDAPSLAPFFPSCDGNLAPSSALGAAAEGAVADNRDTLLDYMLSTELQPHVVERSAAVALGALAAAGQFGGGVSLVEVGCGGGLNLRFDRYAYAFGGRLVGNSPLTLEVASDGAVPVGALPAVVGRYGLDPAPRNPADLGDRLLLESFFAPDAVEQVEHLRTASGILAAEGPLDIRTGTAEDDLLPLLQEAYAAMPEGNTLLLVSTFVWPYLSERQKEQAVWAIQRQAARLTAQKPMAWLQLEPMAGGLAELKLHTFGWTDQEDRTVRRLAETDPFVRQIRWLG